MTDQISYKFEFESGACFDFEVPTRGWTESAVTARDVPPDWARLEVNQCTVCPLSSAEHKYCPAAVDLSAAAAKFAAVASFARARITVVVGHRTFVSDCDMNTGLRSLFGLCMALSGCPIAGRMRPLALRHLPFASVEETMTRVVGAYLMKQYFIAGSGGDPDWELKNLRALYESLENVNQSLMARLRKASESDSNLNAMLGFVSFAQLYTAGLDELLEQEKADFLRGL
ncbi:MAG: hypothetical protein ABIZ04_07810 [Opitutus sp.]